jgi:hypothetical protein
MGFGELQEPTPRVFTPVWVMGALIAGAVGVVVTMGALGPAAICVGAAAALVVLALRFRAAGLDEQAFVPRLWLRPEGLDVAVVGRYAVTYRFVPWSEVLSFDIETADAIWETGPQAYAELSTDGPGARERVRIGTVFPDFPAAVRHYSGGSHGVTWPAA